MIDTTRLKQFILVTWMMSFLIITCVCTIKVAEIASAVVHDYCGL